MPTFSELKTEARFLTNTKTTDYSDLDLERAMNKYYDKVVTFIWRNQAQWRFDDSSKDTFAIAKRNLQNKQQDYLIPTDAREIHRVEVRDKGGEYRRLRRVHEEDVEWSLQEYFDEPGMPSSFSLRGRSVILYPPPLESQVTKSEGLLAYVSRSVTPLSNSSDEPAFAREFHGILPIGAALDWSIVSENTNKRNALKKDYNEYLEAIRAYYAQRDKTTPDRIRPKRESYES